MSTETLQATLSPPDPAIGRSKSAHWMMLGAMAIVYLVLFARYYPCTHGIEDEVGYINQAVVMSRGAISAEGAGFDKLREFAEFKGRHVNWRNPGRSILVLPFLMLGGLPAIFASGAVIHLLLTLVTALTFTRLRRSPLWAVLVLCHPTLSIYSRTIMGDEPAALGLSCALLAFVATNRPGLWVGMAIGLGAVMRYQAGLALPFFALAILGAPHVVQPRRQACHCLLAGGLLGSVLVLYNHWLYGNLLGWVNQGSFALHFVPRNLAFYITSLCVVWPLMFPALFLDRSPIRWAARAICLPLFLLMIGWHAFDHHSNWAYTLVIGQRYLIPVLPAWIVSYALCLEWVLIEGRIESVLGRWLRPLATLACLTLVGLLAAVFQRHDNHLHQLRSARDEVVRSVPEGSLIIANYTLEKLFGVPDPELPTYRWLSYEYQGTAETEGRDVQPGLTSIGPVRAAKPALDHAETIQAEQRTWYIALLPKTPGDERSDVLHDYVDHYHMTRIPTELPILILYKAEAPAGRQGGQNDRSPTTGRNGE